MIGDANRQAIDGKESEQGDSSQKDSSVSTNSEVGTKIDEVVLNIDYKIIEHFSSYLYSSPHKAVEELVTNGFDAGAKEVLVYFSTTTKDCLLVWDNGNSMDADDLKQLWDIANSPKAQLSDGRSVKIGESQRNIIGKFGIGKLASYTVGNLIAHICKKSDRYLYIDVDYQKIFQNKYDSENPGKASIRELSEQEAKELIKSKFSKDVDEFEKFFNQPHWTLAIIERLKNEKPIYEGRLKWILGNSMPIRPDFAIKVNSTPVASKLSIDNPQHSWQLNSDDFQKSVEKSWQEETRDENIDYDISEIKFGSEKGLNPNKPDENVGFIMTKYLGKVWGEVRLFLRPIEKPTSRSSEVGRSHGFFVFVNGRLINEDDDKLLLHEPSFAAFYRSQFLIYADELDSELLADRERIKLESGKAGDLKLIQSAMYRTARLKYDQIEKLAYQQGMKEMVERVPLFSRQFYIEPLTALMNNRGIDIDEKTFSTPPTITSNALGEDGRIADINSDGNFIINSDHPFYKSLDSQFNGRKKQEVLNEFELVALADTLTEGYLHEMGVDPSLVGNIFDWRDRFLRMLVHSRRPSLESVIKVMEDASYFRGAPFENAITNVLNEMGFKAVQFGETGKKDIFVDAFAGTNDKYKLIFEAKALETQDGSLGNVKASVAGAARHRDESGAEHAVIVARKFAGYDRALADGEEVAIYGECAAVRNVSFMTTEALGKLLRVVRRHHYPLDIIKPIFTKNEHPDEKMESINQLDKPFEKVDYSVIIDLIHRHTETYDGDDANIQYLFYDLRKSNKTLTQDDVKTVINALYILARDLIHFDSNEGRVALKQSPENVKRAIADRIHS